MKDKDTGNSKGYGFCVYQVNAQGLEALLLIFIVVTLQMFDVYSVIDMVDFMAISLLFNTYVVYTSRSSLLEI